MHSVPDVEHLPGDDVVRGRNFPPIISCFPVLFDSSLKRTDVLLQRKIMAKHNYGSLDDLPGNS